MLQERTSSQNVDWSTASLLSSSQRATIREELEIWGCTLRKCARHELAVRRKQEAASGSRRERSKGNRIHGKHEHHLVALNEQKEEAREERHSLFDTLAFRTSLVVTMLVAVSVSLPRVLQALLWAPHGINM